MKKEIKQKVKFGTLSISMKIAMIGGWISIISFVVAFGLEMIR